MPKSCTIVAGVRLPILERSIRIFVCRLLLLLLPLLLPCCAVMPSGSLFGTLFSINILQARQLMRRTWQSLYLLSRLSVNSYACLASTIRLSWSSTSWWMVTLMEQILHVPISSYFFLEQPYIFYYLFVFNVAYFFSNSLVYCPPLRCGCRALILGQRVSCAACSVVGFW